jgi:hypothetical protein
VANIQRGVKEIEAHVFVYMEDSAVVLTTAKMYLTTEEAFIANEGYGHMEYWTESELNSVFVEEEDFKRAIILNNVRVVGETDRIKLFTHEIDWSLYPGDTPLVA